MCKSSEKGTNGVPAHTLKQRVQRPQATGPINAGLRQQKKQKEDPRATSRTARDKNTRKDNGAPRGEGWDGATPPPG